MVQEKPKIVLDVGHNEQGVRTIVNQLDNESYNHLHIMLGFSAEKETERILPLFPKLFVFPQLIEGERLLKLFFWGLDLKLLLLLLFIF